MEKTYYICVSNDKPLFWSYLGCIILFFIDIIIGKKWIFGILGLYAVYFCMKKYKGLIITNKTIKINESSSPIGNKFATIDWKDIENAEIKIDKKLFFKRRFLILNPRENINHDYTLRQKLDKKMGLGYFSIFLNYFSRDDEKEIMQIVKKHVKIKGE